MLTYDETGCGRPFIILLPGIERILVKRALAPQQKKSAAVTQLFILGDTSYGADHCDEVNAEVIPVHRPSPHH